MHTIWYESMPNDLTAAQIDALDNPDNVVVLALKITYQGGAIEYLHTGDGEIPQIDGQTYVPGGIASVDLNFPRLSVLFNVDKPLFFDANRNPLNASIELRAVPHGTTGYVAPFFLFRGEASRRTPRGGQLAVEFADPLYSAGNAKPFILTQDQQEARVTADPNATSDTLLDGINDYAERSHGAGIRRE